MKFKCAYDKIVDINKLIPNPHNPNKHPQNQIEMLAKIIDFQGQRSPIIVSNRSGFITKGHGRLLALLRLGWKEVAVDFQDYQNEAEEYADMIADNKIAELAIHDDIAMINRLKEINFDLDFELLGIENLVMPDEAKEEIEDTVPEVDPANVKSKLGDVYEIGNHRLMCGDSTDKETVEKLMNGEKADMVFTDPPYGIDLGTDYSYMGPKSKKHRKIIGDDKDFDPSLILTIEAKEIFLWGANYYSKRLPEGGSWSIWDKYPSDQNDKRYGCAFEVVWSKNKHKQSICRLRSLNVGHHKREDIVHPTQKPINVVEWFFERWGKETKSVLDLFGGSGSTLIACEKTNRKCFMMELDPHYCDVIVSRYVKYSGNSKIKLNGKDLNWTLD